jgi:ribosomal-protein-alanine N-acetyltransferase
VRQARQRRGVGRQLVEWLLASARVAGIASITLELREDNAGAHAFYRRLGFDDAQRLPNYYAGRIAARRMALTVRDAA